jgi:di/tricarboxylate transporter
VRRPLSGFRWLLPLLGSLAVLAAPSPEGLHPEGQRVLAVIVLAIGLWGFETLSPGVTGMVAIIALVFTRAVPSIREGWRASRIPSPTS